MILQGEERNSMSQEYIEITEKTVDDAITLACQKLSVTSTRLDYEVIDEGKAGFFGIGARPARIRARIKDASEKAQAVLDDVMKKVDSKAQKAEKKAEKAVTKETRKIEKEAVKAEKKAAAAEEKAVEVPAQETVQPKEEAPAAAPAETAEPVKEAAEKAQEPRAERPSRNRRDRDRGRQKKGGRGRNDRRDRRFDAPEEPTQFLTGADVPQHQQKKEPAKAHLTDAQIEATLQKSEQFLKDIFGAMDMEVEIRQEYDAEESLLSIEMEGDDMGVLIGKRGQTLDSLQYLVSLIVNKGVDGYIRVKADTEDYRDRRKRTLEQLAKRKAQSVKRNRRPEALEPMNPYERRIIHSALQGDRHVTTYSEGEGEERRVIITLKD